MLLQIPSILSIDTWAEHTLFYPLPDQAYFAYGGFGTNGSALSSQFPRRGGGGRRQRPGPAPPPPPGRTLLPPISQTLSTTLIWSPKMLILQLVKHPISYIGVCYAKTTQGGRGYGARTCTQSNNPLQGDFGLKGLPLVPNHAQLLSPPHLDYVCSHPCMGGQPPVKYGRRMFAKTWLHSLLLLCE